MTAIRTVEAPEHVGEMVEVRGWLHNVCLLYTSRCV